jgi:hypothetical protein
MPRYRILVLAVGLSACVSPPLQQYWFNPKRTLQETGADLFNCRQSARQTSTQQIYTAMELEAPCMTAKGYLLVDGQPTYPAR